MKFKVLQITELNWLKFKIEGTELEIDFHSRPSEGYIWIVKGKLYMANFTKKYVKFVNSLTSIPEVQNETPER